MSSAITVQMLNNVLEAFGEFRPRAWHNPESDQLNFLITERQYGTRRVDNVITLYYGLDDDELVGFKVKGFRALYEKLTKENNLKVDEQGFVDLVSLVDGVFRVFADKALKSQYLSAKKIAHGHLAPPPMDIECA